MQPKLILEFFQIGEQRAVGVTNRHRLAVDHQLPSPFVAPVDGINGPYSPAVRLVQRLLDDLVAFALLLAELQTDHPKLVLQVFEVVEQRAVGVPDASNAVPEHHLPSLVGGQVDDTHLRSLVDRLAVTRL